MITPHRALTIAGSDSGGGAGIQADLKTFSAFGVYGTSAITAVTAQNTVTITAIYSVPLDVIEAQIVAVERDIGLDAVKTGMLGTISVLECVAACVRRLEIPNLVVDPILVAKSGDTLLQAEARDAFLRQLLPIATVVTPNLLEAAWLVGHEVRDVGDMREAARSLREHGVRWVVVKGGHLPEFEDAVDVVFDGHSFFELRSPRTGTVSPHGTGCTFSAAITAGLARGVALLPAIRIAKQFITMAIAEAPPLGKGHPPTNHLAGTVSRWAEALDRARSADLPA